MMMMTMKMMNVVKIHSNLGYRFQCLIRKNSNKMYDDRRLEEAQENPYTRYAVIECLSSKDEQVQVPM
jgi:hypothetical protein